MIASVLSLPASFLTEHLYTPPFRPLDTLTFREASDEMGVLEGGWIHEKVFPGPPRLLHVSVTVSPRSVEAIGGWTLNPP